MVTLFLMGYVVPRFAHITVGGDLPVLSRMLMAWGTFWSWTACCWHAPVRC